jgi:hypothetical protein
MTATRSRSATHSDRVPRLRRVSTKAAASPADPDSVIERVAALGLGTERFGDPGGGDVARESRTRRQRQRCGKQRRTHQGHGILLPLALPNLSVRLITVQRSGVAIITHGGYVGSANRSTVMRRIHLSDTFFVGRPALRAILMLDLVL